MLDYFIEGGSILDGRGGEPYTANVGIQNGEIRFVGASEHVQARETIAAAGLCVAPGFINTHSHTDIVLLFEQRGENILGQGITTEVAGNCGISLIPFSEAIRSDLRSALSDDTFREIKRLYSAPHAFMDQISRLTFGTNIALLVGHGMIRSEVMGYENRPATPGELERMRALLAEAMEMGAFGLSSGLIYPPGVFAGEHELTALCETAAEYDGIYASHIRSESDHVVESVEETIRVSECAGLPALISHHKIGGRHNWGKSRETLALIESANARGQKVRCDQYPYAAGATNLMNALPPKYAENGQAAYLKKLESAQMRNEITRLMKSRDAGFENLILHSGYDGVLVLGAPNTPSAQGKTILALARERNCEPEQIVFDLILENNGNVQAAFFTMAEEDIRQIMRSRYTMGGTDAFYENPYLTSDHPRFRGSFVKILSEYARDQGVMPLPEAVRKLTSLPADLLGLRTKGIIAEGYDADVIIFDEDALRAGSSYFEPHAPNEGVHYVFVNGQIALRDDSATGVLAGELLRKGS